MKSNQTIRYATIAFAFLLSACQQDSEQSSSVESMSDNKADQTTMTSNQMIDIGLTAIDEQGFMQHVNTLASDEFEGREPSTPGGKKTVAYLEDQMKKVGLEPAFNDQGGPSYLQAVDLMTSTVTNNPSMILDFADGTKQDLPYKEKSMSFTTRAVNSSEIKQSELVFVGYGVVAPEYGWDDYAGIDMTGKTAVILVNDPGFRSESDELFKGKTMTYYGRWTYKYEEAARQGAAGAIVVHEDKAAGYPWEVVSVGWSGANYGLFSDDGNMDHLAVAAWITQGAAEGLFSKLDMDYSELVNQAGQAGFKPIALEANASSSLSLTNERSASNNVAGVIKGNKQPDEMFIYTAHWDHLGVKTATEDGEDVIYNGAQDNATGIAGLLEMAEAFKAMPEAPNRSIMFLAVTAEEAGTLGSEYYAENPAFPMSKTVAGINIDSMSTIGATDDIVVVGYGNSEMDNYLRKAIASQNRVLVPEPTPEKGYFYRSDHFNLAKKGVPMLYAKAGQKVRGKPEGYGKSESEKYTNERYHKPQDEVHTDWNNDGIMQDLQAFFTIGATVSNITDWPQWSEGNEFEAIRNASINAESEIQNDSE